MCALYLYTAIYHHTVKYIKYGFSFNNVKLLAVTCSRLTEIEIPITKFCSNFDKTCRNCVAIKTMLPFKREISHKFCLRWKSLWILSLKSPQTKQLPHSSRSNVDFLIQKKNEMRKEVAQRITQIISEQNIKKRKCGYECKVIQLFVRLLQTIY